MLNCRIPSDGGRVSFATSTSNTRASGSKCPTAMEEKLVAKRSKAVPVQRSERRPTLLSWEEVIPVTGQ